MSAGDMTKEMIEALGLSERFAAWIETLDGPNAIVDYLLTNIATDLGLSETGFKAFLLHESSGVIKASDLRFDKPMTEEELVHGLLLIVAVGISRGILLAQAVEKDLL